MTIPSLWNEFNHRLGRLRTLEENKIQAENHETLQVSKVHNSDKNTNVVRMVGICRNEQMISWVFCAAFAPAPAKTISGPAQGSEVKSIFKFGRQSIWWYAQHAQHSHLNDPPSFSRMPTWAEAQTKRSRTQLFVQKQYKTKIAKIGIAFSLIFYWCLSIVLNFPSLQHKLHSERHATGSFSSRPRNFPLAAANVASNTCDLNNREHQFSNPVQCLHVRKCLHDEITMNKWPLNDLNAVALAQCSTNLLATHSKRC